MNPTVPAKEPAKEPVAFTRAEIVKRLKEWRAHLVQARRGESEHTVATCWEHLDRWLDELSAERGR